MLTIEELQKEGFELTATHVFFPEALEILEGREAEEIRIYRETILGKFNPTRYDVFRRIYDPKKIQLKSTNLMIC